MSDHILRITRAADNEHDAEYEIVCPHKHPGAPCTVWWECEDCKELPANPRNELRNQLDRDGVGQVHDLPHQMIGDMICQQGDTCIVLTGHTDYDFDPDGLPAGDHPVVHETEEMCTYITLPKVRQS